MNDNEGQFGSNSSPRSMRIIGPRTLIVVLAVLIGGLAIRTPSVRGGGSDAPATLPTSSMPLESRAIPLAAGPLKVRVTDNNAQPLNQVELVLELRQSNHPTNIVYSTNSQGVCELREVIPPGTTLDISKDDYFSQAKQIGPNDAQVNIVLLLRPHVHGKVIDAKTRQPVDQFNALVVATVASSSGVSFWRPEPFSEGEYHATLPENTRKESPWFMRIEGKGYLPAMSPALNDSGTQDFALTPAPDLRGRVLTPDGQPAAGVTVTAGIPSRPANLSPDGVSRPSGHVCVTGADGQFDLWPEVGKFVLVAASKQGYAYIDQDAFGKSGNLRLTAWGQIQGHVQLGGKPGVNQQVNATPSGWTLDGADLNQASVYQMLSAETDAQGHYTLDYVPVGMMDVTWSDAMQMGSGVGGTHNQQTQRVKVTAGQNSTMNFGDDGRPVVGRVQFPKQWAGNPDLVALVSAQTKQISRPPGAAPNTEATMPRRFYAIETDANGKFHLVDVAAGEYELTVFALDFIEGSWRQATGTLAFTVPPIMEGQSDQPLEIPPVELTPKL